nr:MAG TPA: hypothetical protein [Caudoviricetes sp.]
MPYENLLNCWNTLKLDTLQRGRNSGVNVKKVSR